MSKKDYMLLKAYQETGLSPEEVEQIRRASEYMMFASVGDFVRNAISNFEELQEVKRKVNAAVDDLHGSCKSCAFNTGFHSVGPCGSCVFEICNTGVSEDHWKWRGVRENT